jgi:hypothetical protein
MLVLVIKVIYEVRRWDCFMCHDILYVPSFMKIGTGVQAILWFCLRNLRGYNVGITDGRDCLITPLRWAKMP